MAKASRQLQSWDSKTHEDILISLFQHAKISNADLQLVMADLAGMGYTFSESALRYDDPFQLHLFFPMPCYLITHFLRLIISIESQVWFVCIHLVTPGGAPQIFLATPSLHLISHQQKQPSSHTSSHQLVIHLQSASSAFVFGAFLLQLQRCLLSIAVIFLS
jgi:hypothetical protein